MRFSWLRFLESNPSIEHVFRGANVARNHVNIKCPFCGTLDPSHHMGLHLESTRWGCWRDETHRGIRPHRLIMRLLRCSYGTACSIAGEHDVLATGETVEDLKKRLAGVGKKKYKAEELHVLPELKKFKHSLQGQYAKRYIESRFGDRADTIERIGKLRVSPENRWKYRVIIPIFFKGDLVAVTGRATGGQEVRYLTKPSVDVIYGYDEAKWKTPQKTLVVVEGPLDAINVNALVEHLPFQAVATLGIGFTPRQISLLDELSHLYDQTVILFDRGEQKKALGLQTRCPFPTRVAELEDFKDPGELPSLTHLIPLIKGNFK